MARESRTVLERILATKRQHIARQKAAKPLAVLEREARGASPVRGFAAALDAAVAARGLTAESFDFTSDVIAVIDDDPVRARRDTAANLGFYLSPRVFDCIFDAGGWETEKTQVREAFRGGSLDDVADAVTDRMLEACCLYGTAAEVRDQLARYEGLLDQVVLFAPRQSVPHERHIANYRSLIAAFTR